jgi:hypothetical protein
LKKLCHIKGISSSSKLEVLFHIIYFSKNAKSHKLKIPNILIFFLAHESINGLLSGFLIDVFLNFKDKKIIFPIQMPFIRFLSQALF